MAEPLPTEDQSPVKGFQSNRYGKGLMESLALADSALQDASAFAPAANGVTNGNAHDHSEGDGGTIAYASLSGTPTLGTAAAAAATDFATAAQGTKADSAVQPATLTALGDSTDITVAPVDTLDRIYTANLTGAGTLTVTAAAAGKYAACLLRLTSSANGTNVLAPPAGVRWADGVAVALAPTTGQTIALFVQSVDGTIVLSAAVDRVPA